MRLITILLLFISVTFSLNAKDIEVGDIPPSYIGMAMSGERIELSKMKGKVVVVTFWATWCGPCLKELPVLHEIQKIVSTDKLQVVAVNYGEKKRDVKFIQKQIPDSKILFTMDKRKFASRKFNVVGIPHMLIIDKQGKVAHIHIGYGEDTAMRLAHELDALIRS